MKKALITGITGQDASYLAELLLDKGYEVHGVVRRHSMIRRERIDHLSFNEALQDRFFLHYGDLTDSCNLTALIRQIQPDEAYNLGAQSHVAVSFEVPENTANSTGLGTIRLLDAIIRAEFRRGSTKLQLRNCLEGCRGRRRRMRIRHFILKVPMAWQNCTGNL